LATTEKDKRFTVLQSISNSKKIIIGLGVPTKDELEIYIIMIIFQPNKLVSVYSMEHLHSNEEKYFVSGKNIYPIKFNNNIIAFATCYETSIYGHAEQAFKMVSILRWQVFSTLSKMLIRIYAEFLILQTNIK
jgi:hypothetical protein